MFLDARPCSITIEPERTARLVIDMQNDFGAKGGIFDRAGIDISQIQKVIAPNGQSDSRLPQSGDESLLLEDGFPSRPLRCRPA